MSISNSYSLSASRLQGLAGFLTKLWPDLLALCAFQFWEDGFFTLNVSWPVCKQILRALFFILAWPKTTSVIFQSDTEWNYQDSENHGHLANQPFGKHVLGSFSADLWSPPPSLRSEGFSVNLKITAPETQRISLGPFCRHHSCQPCPYCAAGACVPAEEERRKPPSWQEASGLAGKGGFSYIMPKHIPNFWHQSRMASGVN